MGLKVSEQCEFLLCGVPPTHPLSISQQEFQKALFSSFIWLFPSSRERCHEEAGFPATCNSYSDIVWLIPWSKNYYSTQLFHYRWFSDEAASKGKRMNVCDLGEILKWKRHTFIFCIEWSVPRHASKWFGNFRALFIRRDLEFLPNRLCKTSSQDPLLFHPRLLRHLFHFRNKHWFIYWRGYL